MCCPAVHDRHQRAVDLIWSYIRVVEAQAEGAGLIIPILPLELAVRELLADQSSGKEN